jgi:3D (Asp-Asp-Asp) domain-containing protein
MKPSYYAKLAVAAVLLAVIVLIIWTWYITDVSDKDKVVKIDTEGMEYKDPMTVPTSAPTTTTAAPPTTTTTAPPTTSSVPPRRTIPTTTTRPVRRAPSTPAPPQTGATRSIKSTAYCQRGTMANGHQVHSGAVASIVLPMGSTWRVLTGPMAGAVVTVEDRGGRAATFDIWMASCSQAINYGHPSIQIASVHG